MIIKIKYMLLIALAALVSCSSDEFVGDTGSPNGEAVSGNTAISFGFDVPQVTRAGGATAADHLGNRFIVYGEKGAITNVAPTTGNLVFPNYQVNYADNTSYTTTSNTKNWEYVGYTHSINYQNNITRDPSSAASDEVNASDVAQTIKYWDYSAENYIFTAVSALDDDIENGRVKIQKNEYGTTTYDKGYTITLAKVSETYPSLDKIYLSDRLVISNDDPGTNREAVNKYGGNVTLTFRNLLSQVRAGVYETIPGYDIRSIKFYKTSDVEAKVDETSAFGAICPNVKIGGGFEGTLNVTYYDNNGTVENQAKVAVGNSGSAADLILGTNMSTLSTELLLGKTAVAPTWDTANGDYTNVLPQSVDNTTNLKLKCDYTLWNSVTGETIEVKGATAEIPSRYLQWKSNFKYTYLFKISDNTNGSTGQDVTGLYPITFDAVEMVNGDGKAEYITTVSEPSITTFGVKGGKYTSGKNDYEAGSDIYATFMDGSDVQTPQLTTNNATNYVQIYQVTTTNATTYPITELSVAERLAETPSGSAEITCTNVTTISDGTYFTTSESPSVVSAVPAEDGTTKTINAVKLPGAKTNTYAIEYITYEAVSLSVDDSLVGYYSESGGTYTKQDSGTYSEGTYYKQVKTYKVITVAAAPAP